MSQHDPGGDSQRSRALIGGAGGEILHPPVKLQTRCRRRSRESGLGGKLLVREGDNPDRG